MKSSTNGRTPGSSSTIRNLILLGLVIVGGLVASRVYRWVEAPWSFGFGGASTPDGNWIAPVTLADGTTGHLLMTLAVAIDDEAGFVGSNLGGTARYCLGETAGAFEVSGELSRDGAVQEFGFATNDPNAAWILYTDGGQWDGDGDEPALVLNGRYSFDPTGQHVSISGVEEPTFEIVFEPATAEMMASGCR